jgi:hypothetical protein
MKTYALVDIVHRNICAVHWDEHAAHEAKKIFKSKINLIVYDLRDFQIDPPNKFYLNDYECLNWHISLDLDIMTEFGSPWTQKTDTTLTRKKDHELINSAIPTMLSYERRKELCDQLALYILLVTKISRLDVSRLKSKIDQIFFCEIYMTDIQNKLYNLTGHNESTQSYEELIILSALDKLYE